MKTIQIYKIVNWKIQVQESCPCGQCEPEIFFDAEIKPHDEFNFKKELQNAMRFYQEFE